METFSKEKHKQFLQNPALYQNIYIDSTVAPQRQNNLPAGIDLEDPTSVTFRDANQAEQVRQASASMLQVYFLAFEKAVISSLDRIICSRSKIFYLFFALILIPYFFLCNQVQEWGKVYMISLLVSIIFMLFQFFIRENYLDVSPLFFN